VQVRCYDIITDQFSLAVRDDPLLTLEALGDTVWCMSIVHGYLVVGGGEPNSGGAVFAYNMSRLKSHPESASSDRHELCTGHTEAIVSLVVEGNVVYTGSEDCTVRSFLFCTDSSSKRTCTSTASQPVSSALGAYSGHSDTVWALATQVPSGSSLRGGADVTLFAGSSDATISVLYGHALEERAVLKEHKDGIDGLAVDSSGRFLVSSSSREMRVLFWCTVTFTCVRALDLKKPIAGLLVCRQALVLATSPIQLWGSSALSIGATPADLAEHESDDDCSQTADDSLLADMSATLEALLGGVAEVDDVGGVGEPSARETNSGYSDDDDFE
jgi:WD40 repeat protein